jgi:ATP-binding cassette subfamily B protein
VRVTAVSEEDRLDREQAKHVLRRTARMAAPFRRLMYVGLLFVALSTLTMLLGPVFVRYGIDEGIREGESGPLNAAVVGYVLVTVVAYFAGRQQYVYVNRAGEAFLRTLRVRVFRHIQRQPLAFFDRWKAGVLVSRMTADVEAMSELVQWGLLQFVSAAMLVGLSVVLLVAMSWQLALVLPLVLPVIVVATRRFQRDSNAAYLAVRERVGENLSSLQEGIAGVRVIQAYGREQEQSRRFRRSNRSLYRSHLHSLRVSTWYFGVVEFTGVLSTALAIGLGGWLVHRGSVSVGTVVAAVLLVGNLFEPIQQLSQLYNSVQQAGAAMNKLYAILDTEPELAEVPGAVDLPPRGDIEVESVSFTYAGAARPALHDVSLRIADGERVALVGPTGAGKSTLAKVIARFYDPVEGTVRYGGVDLRDATIASLRQRIVVVPQEGFLFGGTIADNIRIARPSATDEEVRAALASLGVLDRFEQLPEGLATEVRERGSRLSAGERQLVSLARVALVDPAVLVLDEATSNLDPGTELVVEAALEHLMRERTVIVVAHRLSTVQRADRIAVVDHGELVELGTHAELVAVGGRYAALADAWRRSHHSAPATS